MYMFMITQYTLLKQSAAWNKPIVNSGKLAPWENNPLFSMVENSINGVVIN